MNMHEQAQRLWAAVHKQPIDYGRAWVGTSTESVRQMRERQLTRLRHILADMGPSGFIAEGCGVECRSNRVSAPDMGPSESHSA